MVLRRLLLVLVIYSGLGKGRFITRLAIRHFVLDNFSCLLSTILRFINKLDRLKRNKFFNYVFNHTNKQDSETKISFMKSYFVFSFVFFSAKNSFIFERYSSAHVP